MKEELLNFIKDQDMEKEIFILGRITDVEKYLSQADIFIHSSKGEGCSNAILEAMFAGLPIIASNTGGTPEIVSAENGLLFEYKDVKQLESQVKKLIDDPELRQDMGRQSAKFAKENFTVEPMMQNYYHILDQVYQS
jgi:glycosyltransferase involved in cell wall biosynthesis